MRVGCCSGQLSTKQSQEGAETAAAPEHGGSWIDEVVVEEMDEGLVRDMLFGLSGGDRLLWLV